MTIGYRPDYDGESGRVIAEALGWLKTPYHPNARIKGVGVDCAQYPAAVYEAADVIPHVDPKYDRGWHLHRDRELYAEFVMQFAREIPLEDARPADLILWKFARAFSHGGILLPNGEVIHAFIETRCVSIDQIARHEELKRRPKRAFTVWAD